MVTAQELFAHLCGQQRCFILDGAPLPVCQRCFGLYVGATLTAALLAATAAWRHGLPPRRILLLHAACLLAALLGGTHFIDLGPAWRMLCGLWTGHIALLWLTGAAITCRHHPSLPPRWPLWKQLTLALAPPFLATLALLAPLLTTGWYLCTIVALLGAAFLALAATIAILMLCRAFLTGPHAAATAKAPRSI